MEVSNNGSTWSKRVVFMKKDGYYMAWFMAETIEAAQTEFDTSLWKYAREIQPVNPRIAEIESQIQRLKNELETLKELSK
jgi:prefoldin subunit 5